MILQIRGYKLCAPSGAVGISSQVTARRRRGIGLLRQSTSFRICKFGRHREFTETNLRDKIRTCADTLSVMQRLELTRSLATSLAEDLRGVETVE